MLISPSQYSAQLKIWGLRTYKVKGAVSTDADRIGSDTPPQGQTEIALRSPPHQIYPGVDRELESNSYHHDQTSVPKDTATNHHPALGSSLGSGAPNDAVQVLLGASRPGSLELGKDRLLGLERNDDSHSERSPRTPHNAQKVYPFFTASEKIDDAVRRVVQALSEVLADSELEEFFDNLTDMELDEILLNHVKLKEACKAGSAKHTGKLVRLGESFGLRSTRLVQIVSEMLFSHVSSKFSPILQREALENRTRRLYWSTPQAASIGSDKSAMPSTPSSLEKSPATQNGYSTETAAVVHIYDEDNEMQQDFTVVEVSDDVHVFKNSDNMYENESSSCSACVDAPSIEYKVSDNASRLWSELNSRQDRLKALDEMRVLAGCVFAARSYADAFDLYFIILVESKVPGLDHNLGAALDCARSAATAPQDACVEAILHQPLGTFTRRSVLFRTPQSLLREHMLHCFLADLYVKLKKEPNAETHTGKAMLHLDDHKLSILLQGYPNHRQVVAALETQIAKRQRTVSQAIGYNASTVSMRHIQRGLATEVQDHALLKDLLAWCAEIINHNARGLDAFSSVLPKQPIEQHGYICRTLFCYLVERWLDERQRLSSATKPATIITVQMEVSSFEDIVSLPEALSAIAMLIVHDCPDLSRPRAPVGRQPYSWILSSTLLKNIKQLIKSKTSYQSFAEIYLSLMAAPGEVRRQPLNHKSRALVFQFMMNIAPTSLVNRHLPSRGVGGYNSLVPKPDLFRDFEIRPASLSSRLYSPRSSFSSRLNSIRATATKSMMDSVRSLAKRQSGASVTAMSTTSDRSSWSFGAVTGLRRPPSVLSDKEMMDHEAGIIHEEYRDEEMADI